MPNIVPSPRILLIEDDAFLSRLLQDKLTSNGFRVTRVATGQDGLVAVTKTPLPDLVLLDLILPGVDGFEILRQIRHHADADVVKVPVIVLSNLGSEGDLERARQLGANEYWVKAHVSPSEIVAKIKIFLQLPAAEASA